MKLPTRIVEKPWGRTDIPAVFGAPAGQRVGEIWFEEDAGDAAPLMIKFLFTSERLSIQVHPDNAAAAAWGYARGKDECWLVLKADPDAEVGVGLNRSCTPDGLRDAALAGTIEGYINWQPVSERAFIYNRAGTIHAIGPGLMLVEVQQNVDCTFRLYDYGRPRELHLDAAMAVADLEPGTPGPAQIVPVDGTVKLVDGPYFHLIRSDGAVDCDSLPADRPILVAPLIGTVRVDGEDCRLGECAKTHDRRAIIAHANSQALLCWVA